MPVLLGGVSQLSGSFGSSEKPHSDKVSPRLIMTTCLTSFHPSSDFSFLNLWLPAYDFPLFLDYKLPEGNASIPFICIHSFLVQRKRSGFYSRFLWELSYSIGQWDLHWCFLAQGLSQRPQRRQQFLTVFIKQMWSVCSILGQSIQIEQERHYLCLLRAYSSAKKQKT